MAAVIGSLRVVLGLDSAQFTQGLDAAQRELRKAGKSLEKIGSSMQSVGRSLSMGLTVPLLAFGAGALKASADFESAMIRVQISTKAAAQDMAAMEAAARQIGRSTVFSASEAADAMDMLAKTGLGTEAILGGAAKAAVDLAAAAGSELAPAASAISDSMQQFKLSAADLPAVVNQITGAVNESKLDFVDFTQAIGQAGGVAAGLGVNFEDFNAVLAGTSALFASGSDAGTSFKTFLIALIPKTDEAAGLMAKYGLSFFEANGQMKSMSEIAELLRTRLGGLSDEAKTEVLKGIFGTDAMRTAIGLMDQGAAGLDKIKVAIKETDAAAQAAQRMTGLAGQLEQLKGSLEELGIAIGKSGLLGFVTGLVTGFTDLIDKIASVSPVLLNVGVIAAAVAAAIGPLVLVAGAFVSSLGVLASAAVSAGAMLAGMGTTIVALAGPLGLVALGIGAVTAALVYMAAEQAKVDAENRRLVDTMGGAKSALDAYAEATRKAGTATGAAKVTAVEHANALRLEAAAAITAAKALREKAIAAAEAAEQAQRTARDNADPRRLAGFAQAMMAAEGGMGGMVSPATELDANLGKGVEQARARAKAATEAAASAEKRYAEILRGVTAPAIAAVAAAAGQSEEATKKSTAALKKSVDALKELKAETASILESLMTDQERRTQEIVSNLNKLREAAAAGIITWTQYHEAVGRMDAGPLVKKQVEQVTGELKTMGNVVLDLRTDIERAAEEMSRAFEDVTYSIDDIFYALKNKDWMGAIKGVLAAVKAVKEAFGKNGTTAGKVGAVAGVADAIGQAVGGTAGSTLSGAASGAMAGFSVGGPIGAVIGGVLGGIGGFLSGSSAKKKAKAEAEERARQAAAERAAQVAAQHRELEIALLEAQGKATEALAARRADELAGIDATNRGLQEQLWALQDAADAAAKAAALANAQRGLEIQLMEAQGDATGALAAKRQIELAALDASLQGLQAAIYAAQDFAQASALAADQVASARDDLREAWERERADLQATIDKFRAFATSLKAFRASLDAADPSEAALAAAGAEFQRVASLARLGNEEALGDLQGVSEKFLAVSEGQSKTLLDHLRNVWAVKAAVEAAENTASRTASIAEQQLASLDAQVAGLLQINASVLSVAQAIANLQVALSHQQAIASQQALVAATPPPVAPPPANDSAAPAGPTGWAGYLARYPSVMAEYQEESTRDAKSKAYLQSLGIFDAEGYAKWHFQRFGQAAGLIPGFATGGGFTVGGFGGTDSQLVKFRATPGEMVDVHHGSRGDDAAAAIRSLEARFGPVIEAMALSGHRVATKVVGWDGAGLPGERAA